MHPFFTLREKLPALTFDPDTDKPFSSALLSNYLKFYQLDFSEDVCSRHQAGTFHSGKYTLTAQYWLPAKQCRGSILVLHGYFDHVGLYSHLIRHLLETGFSVIAYDQPGHGLSSGEKVFINSFSEYSMILDDLLNRIVKLPAPVSFIGQSTGCAVFLQRKFIDKKPEKFQKAVLLAPLLRPSHWGQLKWVYYVLSPFIKTMPRRTALNSNDSRFVHFVHFEDPLQATYYKIKWVTAMNRYCKLIISSAPSDSCNPLIIQGNQDTTVDWEFNLRHLHTLLPNASVYQLDKGRHHLVNEREDLRDKVFDRIDAYLLASC